MQKLTGKEIIVRKSEATALLADALCFHDFCERACINVAEAQNEALFWAWLAGVRLLQIKPAIAPTGEWMIWVEMNFCALRGLADDGRTARNYMKIASDNSKLEPKIDWLRVAKGEADLQLVTQLKFDTIRKYRIGFVPEKSQPEHKDDFKFERSTSFLNIVNEFERLYSRHVDGLELIELDAVRRQTPRLYRFLKCVHETPDADPFAI